MRIGIIGAGFSGTMTAVQLIEKTKIPIEIYLIDQAERFNLGIAYRSYSDKHLLNVSTGKMSAFPDDKDHFLNWVMQQIPYRNQDRMEVSTLFLPRNVYGNYLKSIWTEAVKNAAAKNTSLNCVDGFVEELQMEKNAVALKLNTGEQFLVDTCVLASGNQIPRNPSIHNVAFFKSQNYFQNPWKLESVENPKPDLPILIIGNGLTMVDSVIGLLEQGFEDQIISISPNGFSILPHEKSNYNYTALSDEYHPGMNLQSIVKLVNKHLKIAKKEGIPTEILIDSLRPHTQTIWKSLSAKERKFFLSRLRHLWGVARHRIPGEIHAKIQILEAENCLQINSGKIIDLEEQPTGIKVVYLDKKDRKRKTILVSRVINCTGPETDLMQVENPLLRQTASKGLLLQDELKLGISSDPSTFQLKQLDGTLHKHLFTIGSNLKGELWESTAVNEIRNQAKKIAGNILGDEY